MIEPDRMLVVPGGVEPSGLLIVSQSSRDCCNQRRYRWMHLDILDSLISRR